MRIFVGCIGVKRLSCRRGRHREVYYCTDIHKMATIQQLEKLHHIQRLFHVEDSLEAAVAGERVKLLIEKTEQLIRQRTFLREERRILRLSAEKLEERKQGLDLMRKPNWVPESLRALPKRCIQVNIGGLVSGLIFSCVYVY